MIATPATQDKQTVRRVLMSADCVGGVWTYAMELARALAAREVEVALAVLGGPMKAAQRAQALDIPGLSLHESDHRLEWMEDPWQDLARAGNWLLDLEAELRPDIVHLNHFAHGGSALACAQAGGWPLLRLLLVDGCAWRSAARYLGALPGGGARRIAGG